MIARFINCFRRRSIGWRARRDEKVPKSSRRARPSDPVLRSGDSRATRTGRRGRGRPIRRRTRAVVWHVRTRRGVARCASKRERVCRASAYSRRGYTYVRISGAAVARRRRRRRCPGTPLWSVATAARRGSRVLRHGAACCAYHRLRYSRARKEPATARRGQ